MSLKGIIYTGLDDPKLPGMLKNWSDEKKLEFIVQHNETMAIEEICDECKDKLITSEVVQHHIDHIEKGDARVLCGMYARAKPEIKELFVKWLNKYGKKIGG